MSEEEFDQEAFVRESQRDEELRRHDLMRTVEFGQAVQKFLDGPIGQKMFGDSERELKGLSDAIFDLDVDVNEDRNHLRQIMARAGVLRHWQDAFAGYIISGRNAEKELAEDEQTS